MKGFVFYWVLAIIVLISMAMLIDVSAAIVATVFISVIAFAYRSVKENEKMDCFDPGDGDSDVPIEDVHEGDVPTVQLKPEIIANNEVMLDDVLNPPAYSADDKIFNMSVVSGYKEKKAKEIRSHWNNDNWKKYYDYEMGIHAQENRDWWADDDFELSKRHVLI